MKPAAPERAVRAGTRADPVPARRRVVLRGTVITTAAVGLGTLLGLARDLLMAGLYGANGQTDAFLVAWTLPETAVPLLIDGAMTLLMVPIFSRALRERGERGPDADPATDPVRAAVAATMPRLVAALVVVAALVAATAPWLVTALAPGLADPSLGVAAMRVIAVSVVFVGIAGYLVAALRSHLVYGPPAMITVVMNVGIIGVMVLAHRQLGVLAAVLGAVLGSALMVAVQAPAFVRRVGLPRRAVRAGGGVAFAALLPIAVYILARQGQVFVERFVASWLAPGTISHLNYVQKIAQVPATLALTLAVVTFPQLARQVVAGRAGEAHRRTVLDVQIIGAVVLAATAFLAAFAPEVVGVLFERGAFTLADTAATASILRVYVWGLLGQALLDIVCRSLFSERATRVPAVAMVLGVLATGALAVLGAPVWGATAIAAANAVGITATAAVVICSRRSTIVPARAVGVAIARLLPATALAALFACWLEARLRSLPLVASVATGVLAVASVFGLTALLCGALPVPPARALPRTLFRRLAGRTTTNQERAGHDA